MNGSKGGTGLSLSQKGKPGGQVLGADYDCLSNILKFVYFYIYIYFKFKHIPERVMSIPFVHLSRPPCELAGSLAQVVTPAACPLNIWVALPSVQDIIDPCSNSLSDLSLSFIYP